MILGITGSIACGKSIVVDYLKQKGFNVLSLDEISHDLFDQEEVNELIKEAFDIKKEIKVTRSEISNIVFDNKEKLAQLNKILHPLIYKQMNEYIDKARKNNENLFVEVPLLYEEKLESYFDKIVLIYVNKENELIRLMERNKLNKDEALKRINSQIDIELKKEKAMKQNAFLIDNNYDLDYTYKAIDKIIEQIK